MSRAIATVAVVLPPAGLVTNGAVATPAGREPTGELYVDTGNRSATGATAPVHLGGRSMKTVELIER